MAWCSNCRKNLGLFSRKYKCLKCGDILCNDCKNVIELSSRLAYSVYRLANLPDADIICSYASYLFKTRKDAACLDCLNNFYSEYILDVERAVKYKENVELLPSTYKGKRKIVGKDLPVKSAWHTDWDDCDNELKALASYYGCEVVININRNKDTETYEEDKDNGKGTYTRTQTIWQKEGIAYPLKH